MCCKETLIQFVITNWANVFYNKSFKQLCLILFKIKLFLINNYVFKTVVFKHNICCNRPDSRGPEFCWKWTQRSVLLLLLQLVAYYNKSTTINLVIKNWQCPHTTTRKRANLLYQFTCKCRYWVIFVIVHNYIVQTTSETSLSRRLTMYASHQW